MAPQWTSFTATPIYNQGALVFSTKGTTIPTSGMISGGTLQQQLYIPLRINKIGAQTEGSQVTEVTYGNILDQPSNLASGGTALSLGANQLSKIVLEGWMDTPATQISSSQLYPGLTVDGKFTTFGELLAVYYEGRQVSAGNWQRSRPLWFRDSYGRVYTSPLILDLTVQKVEAVPYRENFTMTLVI